jgi:hypothetical protein
MTHGTMNPACKKSGVPSQAIDELRRWHQWDFRFLVRQIEKASLEPDPLRAYDFLWQERYGRMRDWPDQFPSDMVYRALNAITAARVVVHVAKTNDWPVQAVLNPLAETPRRASPGPAPAALSEFPPLTASDYLVYASRILVERRLKHFTDTTPWQQWPLTKRTQQHNRDAIAWHRAREDDHYLLCGIRPEPFVAYVRFLIGNVFDLLPGVMTLQLQAAAIDALDMLERRVIHLMVLLRHDLEPRPSRRPDPIQHSSPMFFVNMPDGSVRTRTWQNERAAAEMAQNMDALYEARMKRYRDRLKEEEWFRCGSSQKKPQAKK